MYRKKLMICSLLVFQIILISSCNSKKEPQLQLIVAKTLTDFPSASAIEYANGKFYVFGDDATYLLILDSNYNRVDTVHYSTQNAYRISKFAKPDIESATIISVGNEMHLYALGSLSTQNRMELFYFPLVNVHGYSTFDYSPFAEKLKALPELNIEGLAFVYSKLVMSNRANKTHKTNKLIISDDNFDENKNFPPTIIDLLIDSTNILGVSGLYYVEEKDLLLFTASEEDTPNALDDGKISDSYLGFIEKFSAKMEDKTITPNQLIKLSTINKIFIKQKIESVCVEKITGSEMILHLVADNDNGESRLFKMKVVL